MKNLEAKFRLVDLAEAEARATALGYTRRAILNQRDTFFRVPNGKLKLREENGTAVLIFYRRVENGTLMLSNYEIVPLAEPASNAPNANRCARHDCRRRKNADPDDA